MYDRFPLVVSLVVCLALVGSTLLTGIAPGQGSLSLFRPNPSTSSASGLLSASPNPVKVCSGTTGSTVLSWSATTADPHELRKDSVTGQLLTTTNGSGQYNAQNITLPATFYLRKQSYEWQWVRGKGWQRVQVWSTVGQTTVTSTLDGCVNTVSGAKASFHRFSNLKAGMVQTAQGWRVQDHAWQVVNTSSQEVDVTWKMIADDPNFVFKDGQRGIWIRKQAIGTGINGVWPVNVAVAEPGHVTLPVKYGTFFTGTSEFSACVKNSNPCQPVPVYAYMLPQTPIKVGADYNMEWFKAWDEWRDTNVLASWDDELNGFVIPYTNYWYKVASWPRGWKTSIAITNLSNVPVRYSLKHVPGILSRRVTQVNSCNIDPSGSWPIENKDVVLQPNETKLLALTSLYGWNVENSSMMEGYMVISSESVGFRSTTQIHGEIVPNNTAGKDVCDSAQPADWNTDRFVFTSPANNASLSGTIPLTLRVAQDRGTNIASVKFYVDGNFVGNGIVDPNFLAYDSVFNWNSSSVSAGTHTITAKAFRSNGTQMLNTPSITVTTQTAQTPLTISVDPAEITAGGSYTLRAMQGSTPYSGMFDARFSVCKLDNPTDCTTPSVPGPWGTNTSNAQGNVLVTTQPTITPGIYNAQFRPRGQTSVPWSNEISVRVNPR